jgi:gamma-glutamyltranspeptidase / glutathione hydrolase
MIASLTERTFAMHRAQVATSTKGMVSSASPIASAIGRDVLADGGNAVDATVATALAMAVTWPEAGNIGGGGFMMIAPPGKDVECIDYRETAPASCGPNSFIKQEDHHCAKMAGTPGTVRGLWLAHQKYGKLPWRRLVEPAVKVATEGVAIDQHLASSLRMAFNTSGIDDEKKYAELHRVYGRPGGGEWKTGDTLKLPDLACTLQRIADDGPDGFYSGETAKLIVTEMQAGGGSITAEDLAKYEVKIRPAVHATVWGHEIYGPPPPSSGGATLLLMLQILEARGWNATSHPPSGKPWTGDQLHLLAEAARRGFRERAATIGDPDFVATPIWIGDAKFAAKLAATIDPKRATSSRDIAGDIKITAGPYESEQTTHFSVVDGDGMAVSNTYTLEESFGSFIVVRGAGFILNNEMGDFNWRPGYTNEEGAVGTLANQIAPRKRMLSSQTPVIVQRDGKNVLVTGSPGGRTIINTVACVLTQRLALGRSLAEAIEAPRIHQQWFPDRIQYEAWAEELLEPLIADLKARGHKVENRGANQGAAHSIEIDPATGVITGVADWRRGGAAVGVQ